ncbi:Uncharacterised protein [Capnocytophaga ochracea]|uniref:PD-(D/E)XK motif protein n=2 Tax=Capnocytophaga ochracea TaxID=1018 RepID=A0A7Z8YCF0_CAPOC|nr:Uncharacterised protein [Capnocytophaga ochracea]
MIEVYKIFEKLQQKTATHKDGFIVTSLPSSNFHKIGVSHDGFPLFFIECSNTYNAIDINLELISVTFNRPCILYENRIKIENLYTIISLKTINPDIQKYFIEIVIIIIKQFPKPISDKQFKEEIQKLIDLFKQFSQPAYKTIQGIWAELLIIEQSEHPEYLVQSWHTSPSDKFDFNDGKDKIEVKSTSRMERIHKFSLEQLKPNNTSNLLIASVFVNETGKGKNIGDLSNNILKRINNLALQFRLREIISKTLGRDIEKSFDVYFDYQQAIDSIRFFDYKNIPTIKNDIPPEINNISFNCNLSNITTINNKDIDSSGSILFKSL